VVRCVVESQWPSQNAPYVYANEDQRLVATNLTLFSPVCPYCCNCLTIARAVASPTNPEGCNAFTCRTCPYQFVLDQPYFERTYMKKKQKDDILGEEQTDLPINEGQHQSIEYEEETADFDQSLEVVRTPNAIPSKHISISCRLEALTSLLRRSTR
jgi:hypothetical protein